MDESLLRRHGIGSNYPRRDITRPFNRRSDAIAFGSPYQKAAALVDLAEDGVGLPEEILYESNFQNAAKYYFMYTKLDIFWTINLFALVVLNFLEKPLWCAKYEASAASCNDREYFFLGQLPYLTSVDSLIYEGVTLILLIVYTFFPLIYEGYTIFWKNLLNILKILCLLILVTDLVVYSLYLSPWGITSLPFRIAPYIRIVFFILNVRELRQTMVILAGMLGTYLNVMVLGLLFLLFSSWLAYVIFEDTEQGREVFPTYGATLYNMLILFTTSNYPNVWIPAYKASRWYCLFFILYVLLGVYFITNLILAVVYDSFKSELAKQVGEMDNMRKKNLAKAFNLIDDRKVGYLQKEQCIKLFEELNKYRTLPNITNEEFELIFDELDDSRDFKINLDEFADLCNAISLRFQKEEIPPWLENYPNFYNSPLSKMLKDFVRGPRFGYIITFFLLLNTVAVITETTLDIENNSGQKYWQVVEFTFGWIYVLEMVLKVYALGFENYWTDGQNRFDFVVTCVIAVGETATFVSPRSLTFLSNGEWIRYLLIARMLRLIRLLMDIKRYRAFVATFLTLIPSLMPYLGTIFCVLCMYCSLGVQVFGGLVNVGNPQLEGSTLADDDYTLFNFNDYPNGMVTLFNLLVMGNWQDWMEGYKELSGSTWSIAYFISFYLITVLLLLNLVIAFVLEAFFAEMEIEDSVKCEDDKEAEESSRRRRFTGTKTRSQRVDALLHHMLSAELEQKQCSTS